MVRLTVSVLALTASLAAYERILDPATINDAIAIGISRSEADRARFHRPYRAEINRAPIDSIDVITPFRRVVLSAEAHTREGGRLYGQAQAMAVVKASPEQVDVVVEMTFHPLNNFVGVPAYDVALVRGRDRLAPAATERVPRYGTRLTGTVLPYPFGGGGARVPTAEPLSGGTIVAHFDGNSIERDAVVDVLVLDGPRELARGAIAFGALR